MKTIGFTILLLSLLTLTSCTFNFGKVGNGNVVTQTREIRNDFTGIKTSAGIEVHLTQGDAIEVVVEADENLQQDIKVSVENDVLKIGTTKNIGMSESKKVYVTYITLDNISASSGSEIHSEDIIKSQQLSISASSGADINFGIFSQDLNLHASSGGTLEVRGKSTSLDAKASSGGTIKGKDLKVINCSAKASSGGEIYVNVKDRIEGKASSGGEITYFGNPTDENIKKSNSGSVRRK